MYMKPGNNNSEISDPHQKNQAINRLPAIDRLEGSHPCGRSLYRRVLVPVHAREGRASFRHGSILETRQTSARLRDVGYTSSVVLMLQKSDADTGFLEMILTHEERTGTAMPIDSLIILSESRLCPPSRIRPHPAGTDGPELYRKARKDQTSGSVGSLPD